MAYSAHDSKKEILSEALHKARNAVFFDDRGNYKDAIRAYGDTCALLGQVMRTTLESEDRNKVEAIVGNVHDRRLNVSDGVTQRITYIKRIYELQGSLGDQ